MQIGRTRDQGLYNKHWAAVHPEALAAGTLPQYNTPIDSYSWYVHFDARAVHVLTTPKRSVVLVGYCKEIPGCDFG